MKKIYIRWAMAYKNQYTLGPLCWANSKPGMTRLFNTRQKARKAQKTMISYRGSSRVVKVRVTIEEI